MQSNKLRSREALYRVLAERLREEILAATWSLGDPIPTEARLVDEYGVSRATVRQALSVLEHEGYLITRHGSGRYVARPQAIVSAGVEQLKSISTTIAEQGHKASMRYHAREFRSASEHEASMLNKPPAHLVLSIQREFLADGVVVAYSYDILPNEILPPDFDLKDIDGSVFAFLESKCGITAKSALARVHAVQDKQIGWRRQKGPEPLYVLLDQVHFSTTGEPVLYSKTYFIEGRVNLSVVRTR
jgi:GntR family transcriptional regulator